MTSETTTGVRLARISDQPLDPTRAEAAVTGPEHGAVVVFTGKVRNHDGGQAVAALEYSAHPRAERFLRECCAAIATSSG
ncbi:molybdenum cofactor biosynthesis protein MoaE, partial [Mycobacterium tuberculosis]|nr:molybdenum cofactor biosynthesis protein MoaE [Mycobacterium tuberculosis]